MSNSAWWPPRIAAAISITTPRDCAFSHRYSSGLVVLAAMIENSSISPWMSERVTFLHGMQQPSMFASASATRITVARSVAAAVARLAGLEVVDLDAGHAGEEPGVAAVELERVRAVAVPEPGALGDAAERLAHQLGREAHHAILAHRAAGRAQDREPFGAQLEGDAGVAHQDQRRIDQLLAPARPGSARRAPWRRDAGPHRGVSDSRPPVGEDAGRSAVRAA